MKVCIVGAGAMGSLFGGRLAYAGIDVTLYDIFAEHVDAINREGLSIIGLEGAVETIRPAATGDIRETAGADAYIFFVKSNATARAASAIALEAPEGALAVTLQNGLGNGDILAAEFGSDRTVVGVTSQGATFLGPGRIRHGGTGPTHLATISGRNDILAPLVKALGRAGIETHVEPNIDDLIWSKLVINVGINALTALTGFINGQLAAYGGTKELMELLVDEAVAVAKARGVTLAYEDPVARVLEVAHKTAQNRSSMLQDVDRGRPTEIDVINGAIVAEGRRLAVPTPYNRAVTLLVRTLDQKRSREKGPGESP